LPKLIERPLSYTRWAWFDNPTTSAPSNSPVGLPLARRADEVRIERACPVECRVGRLLVAEALEPAAHLEVRRRVGVEDGDGAAQRVERAERVVSVEARRARGRPHARLLLALRCTTQPRRLGRMALRAVGIARRAQDPRHRLVCGGS